MAYYLVRAKPSGDMDALRQQLDDDTILVMRPFGTALHHSLLNARQTDDGYAIWEEEDYCSPPLAMERRAVLDSYFSDLSVERVTEGDGWSKIEHLPSLWAEIGAS